MKTVMYHTPLTQYTSMTYCKFNQFAGVEDMIEMGVPDEDYVGMPKISELNAHVATRILIDKGIERMILPRYAALFTLLRFANEILGIVGATPPPKMRNPWIGTERVSP